MQLSLPFRLITATCLAATTLLQAQSGSALRAKPSASSAPAVPPTAPPVTPPLLTPAQRPAHRADVTYADSMLTVSASNSSLNQILREISRLTGIKITGGVGDERVFGNYGPAVPSQVLATLLDGTGSNMLLIQSRGATPTELILTPRQGGPTPPNPSASGSDEVNDSSSEDAPPNPVAQPIRPPVPSQYAPRPMNPGDHSVPEQNPGAPNTQPTDPAQQQSPNNVKTPQQIYDQLQQLRQQQQQQQQQQRPQ